MLFLWWGWSVVRNDDFFLKNMMFAIIIIGVYVFVNIQIIIDDYTWFERTIFDGREKFVLKARPILSEYQNQESLKHLF